MTYKDLIEHYRRYEVLGSIGSLLHWDMETQMPNLSANLRGEQLALLNGMQHDLLTEKNFIESIQSISLDETTNEGKQINKLRTLVAKNTTLDKKIVEALAKAEVSTMEAWKQAREANNFNLVKDKLTSLLALVREKANAYREHPQLKSRFNKCSAYEVLLDEFEPGMEANTIRSLLSNLVSGTKELISSGKINFSREQYKIPLAVESQKALNKKIAEALGFDFSKGRLDVSVHPFCGGHPNDVRMTTRYDEKDVLESITGVVHETGHALYESNLPKESLFTPCGHSCSMGIHESQSRFYENFIGRSFPFAQYLSPLIGVPAEEIFKSINQVSLGFIRVEADELTYNLHIALRMALEEKLVNGALEVKDLPEVWNETFKDYFNLTPPNDIKGCLQDMHWYGGAFGYFPTYSLGNMLAAELYMDFSKESPEWEDRVRNGDFKFIVNFMTQRVHSQASFNDSPKTIQKALGGRSLGAEAFLSYVAKKYTSDNLRNL